MKLSSIFISFFLLLSVAGLHGQASLYTTVWTTNEDPGIGPPADNTSGTGNTRVALNILGNGLTLYVTKLLDNGNPDPAHTTRTITGVSATYGAPYILDVLGMFGSRGRVRVEVDHTVSGANFIGLTQGIEGPTAARTPHPSYDPKKLVTVEKWGNNVWTRLHAAFHGSEKMELSASDVPNLTRITNLEFIFRLAQRMTDTNNTLGSWDVSRITNMNFVFDQANNFNRSLENWDVRRVTTMVSMFGDAHKFNQPLTNWQTLSLTETADMFRNARAFNQPLNHFDMSKVTRAQLMFSGASAFNQPLDSWNVENLQVANTMFNYATSFNQDLSSWKLKSLVSAPNMFRYSGMSCSNYSNMLRAWAAYDQLPNNINFTNQTTMTYNYTALAAVNTLAAKGWNFGTTTTHTYVPYCGMTGKLWIGTNSTDWDTAGNWLDNQIPASGETVIFATVNNYTHTAINDLNVTSPDRIVDSLINESTKALVVLPENRITINGRAIVNGDERIVVKAGSTTQAGGSLLFTNPANNANVPATVELYTKSYKRNTGGGAYPYLWQYIGIPVKSLAPSTLGTQTRVRAWDETRPELDKWQNVTGNLEPFFGYEMTGETETTHRIKGTLVTESKTVALSRTAGVSYTGLHLLANPYASAIEIALLNFNGNMENSVYVYNTGSRHDWQRMSGMITRGVQPGQYIAVPHNLAGQQGLPSQIPSMQAFFVQTWTNAPQATVTMNYSNLSKNTEALRSASGNKGVTLPAMVLDVVGAQSTDRLWLFEAQGTTRSFDNGWDGRKFASGNTVQLYAFNDNRAEKFQVASASDLAGMELGLTLPKEGNYTLHFDLNDELLNGRQLFLQDTRTRSITRIAKDRQLIFYAAAGETGPRFRIIDAQEVEENSTLLRVYTQGNVILVENLTQDNAAVQVFNVIGNLVYQQQLSAQNTLRIEEGTLPQGVYIVKAATNSHSATQRAMVRK